MSPWIRLFLGVVVLLAPHGPRVEASPANKRAKLPVTLRYVTVNDYVLPLAQNQIMIRGNAWHIRREPLLWTLRNLPGQENGAVEPAKRLENVPGDWVDLDDVATALGGTVVKKTLPPRYRFAGLNIPDLPKWTYPNYSPSHLFGDAKSNQGNYVTLNLTITSVPRVSSAGTVYDAVTEDGIELRVCSYWNVNTILALGKKVRASGALLADASWAFRTDRVGDWASSKDTRERWGIPDFPWHPERFGEAIR